MKQANQIKKIGIDARFFGPMDKGPGRYTQELVENLEKIDKTNQYFIFLRKNRWYEYKPKNPNFKKALANYEWYSWREQLFFPFKIKKYNLDLMHFTHFNAPILYGGNFIITIHDLILRNFPTHRKNLRNFLFYPFKQLMYRLVFRQAVERAKKIIAVSRYTKKDILKYYNINSGKIEVIYEGSLISRPVISKPAKRKYLLYVGNAYPHKNLESLILAFRKIKQDNFDLQLVLVGGDDYFYKKLKKNNDDVIFPGFVKDEDLNILYNNATLYVFPSLSEGFGLPPLEAMARGIPVVSSNATCLPEILGDAALYFNPLDINDMAEKIKKVLIDENLRKKLIEKGFEQIKKYSWEKMAEETLKIYLKAPDLQP